MLHQLNDWKLAINCKNKTLTVNKTSVDLSEYFIVDLTKAGQEFTKRDIKQ